MVFEFDLEIWVAISNIADDMDRINEECGLCNGLT